MTRISIALCTYNGEKYISEQLESFAAQSRTPDELVVCDDRSSDRTVEIIEAFAETAEFAVSVFVNEQNLGSTRNFEKAIALCDGDLIFLSDQDDVWMSEKLARIERAFSENEAAGLVFSDAELVDEKLHPLNRRLSDMTFQRSTRDDLASGRAFESLLDQNFVTGATAAFRAGLRDILTPTPDGIPNLIHDGWIAMSIAKRAAVIFIDEPLIKYRQHGSQQVGLRVDREDDRSEFFGKTILTLGSEIERLQLLGQIDGFADPRLISRLLNRKEEYLEHCRIRRDLPASRIKRLPSVMREVTTGRYARFSRGPLSAVKDLFEK